MEIAVVVLICMLILLVGTIKVICDCKKLDDDTIEDNPYSLVDSPCGNYISYM